MGGREVTIIYRRTMDEMPARPEEVDGAEREGATILFLTNPTKITEKDGKLTLECIRMKLGEPDASGRRSPVPIEHSEFTMEVDNVISAIGQIPEVPAGFGVETGRGNAIKINRETQATSRKGVFACGDAVTGPASVIEAVAASKKAADSIDRYLGGEGLSEEATFRAEEPYMGRTEDFEWIAREKMPALPLAERLKSCNGVELGFDRDAAMREANRCLYCNVRLKISQTIPPPIIEVKWKLIGRETK
jgi:NADPH-dependent glutamate synthase beta subunit-like oxidoreductase